MSDGIGLLLSNISTASTSYIQLLAQHSSLAPRTDPASPAKSVALYRSTARALADQGQRTLNRIAFWRGVGEAWFARPLALRKLDALADELDETSEAIEGWTGAADAIGAEAKKLLVAP